MSKAHLQARTAGPLKGLCNADETGKVLHAWRPGRGGSVVGNHTHELSHSMHALLNFVPEAITSRLKRVEIFNFSLQ